MKAIFLQQRSLSTNKKLFVFFGESNSGGLAPNSSATSQELAPRNLQILNNNSFQFEPLDIGTNNLIGHSQLEYAMYNSHGMELQLANKYDEGYFGSDEVFLVKAGQGGSFIADWEAGDTNYTTFLSRVNQAISLLNIASEDVYFMLSIGINNRGVNTPTATYKAGLKDLVQRVKVDLNLTTYNLSIMKLDFVTNLNMTDYNQAITEVSSEENVQTFSTLGLTKIPDGYHLDYAGMKDACDAFLSSL